MLPVTVLGVSVRHIQGGSGPGGPSLRGNWQFDLRALGQACIGLLAGLLVYLVLPLRAALYPPIDWGDPVTPERFLWLVSGRLYQSELRLADFSSAWLHLQGMANLTLQQFGVIGLIAAIVGLILFFAPSRLYLLTAWMALVFTLFAIAYQTADSYVYLLPLYLAASIWIGLAVGRSIELFSPYFKYVGPVLGLVLLAYLTVLGLQHRSQVDGSPDDAAEAYGEMVMSKAPARAILFAQGYQAVFTLWYFHYGLRERADLVVIATDLLPFDWYRESLRHTYPDLALPTSSQEPWLLAISWSNADRPACYLNTSDSLPPCQ